MTQLELVQRSLTDLINTLEVNSLINSVIEVELELCQDLIDSAADNSFKNELKDYLSSLEVIKAEIKLIQAS